MGQTSFSPGPVTRASVGRPERTRLARRRRRCRYAEPPERASFGILCCPGEGAAPEDDPMNGAPVVVPVSSEAAADILQSLVWREELRPGADRQRLGTLVRRLAFFPDSIIRREVAQYEDLSRTEVLALSRDVCREVRLNVLQNIAAIGMLTAEEVLACAAGDAEVLSESLEALSRDLLRRPGSADARGPHLRQLAEALAGALEGFPDPQVQEVLHELREGLEPEACAAAAPRRARLRARPGKSHAADAAQAQCAPAGAVCSFGLVRRDDSGRLQMTDEAVVLDFRILAEALGRVGEAPGADVLFSRLASHPSCMVREATAENCTSPAVLQRLKDDAALSVRRALLNNEAFCRSVSARELLRITGGDPELVHELCSGVNVSQELARLARETFGASPDTLIQRALLWLDDEESLP